MPYQSKPKKEKPKTASEIAKEKGDAAREYLEAPSKPKKEKQYKNYSYTRVKKVWKIQKLPLKTESMFIIGIIFTGFIFVDLIRASFFNNSFLIKTNDIVLTVVYWFVFANMFFGTTLPYFSMKIKKVEVKSKLY